MAQTPFDAPPQPPVVAAYNTESSRIDPVALAPGGRNLIAGTMSVPSCGLSA
jgi:hypothetical protein